MGNIQIKKSQVPRTINKKNSEWGFELRPQQPWLLYILAEVQSKLQGMFKFTPFFQSRKREIFKKRQ